MEKRQERLQLLERQIKRLKRRIDKMEERSNRYSWTRVGIFFGGLIVSVVGLVVSWWLCALLVGITLVAFGIAAYYHSKIDNSIARHIAWMHIKASHIARMRLDWERIPSVHVYTPDMQREQASHPFEFDLDITGERSIHQLVNTAISYEGGQRLRAWLLSTKPDPATIEKRQTLVRELIPLSRFRDKLTLKSFSAAQRSSEHLEGKRLLRWLRQQEASPHLGLLLWGSTALHALTAVLFLLALFLSIPQIWMLTLLGSILLFFMTAKIRGDIFDDASYLRYALAMLSTVFSYLETYPYGKNKHLKQLCAPFFTNQRHSPSRELKATERIASAAVLKNNGLLWFMLNSLIPWDNYCAYRLQQQKARIATHLPGWLNAWFELEALCSLATFTYLNPEYILPEILPVEHSIPDGPPGSFTDSPTRFVACNIGHPLIPVEKRVTNDFSADTPGSVMIITGSNMSGKSTFLRTLGVNLCLAFAGGPVSASHFQTTPFRLFSCIRVSDSVTDGYSYFYAEVRRLRALLDALAQDGEYPLFFLIDEIFKGTNNRERLIGSRSYVRAVVGRNCIGAISTHDLELVKLADILPLVQNYHFREEVIDGQMAFDYRLRSGPSPTTNALKIMRMEGLPVEENA